MEDDNKTANSPIDTTEPKSVQKGKLLRSQSTKILKVLDYTPFKNKNPGQMPPMPELR